MPHLSAADLECFLTGWKVVFVSHHATVPYQSLDRLLALHRADRLEVLQLGRDHRLEPADDSPGAGLVCEGGERRFAAFVDATRQQALDAADLPSSLSAQSAVREGVVEQFPERRRV